MTRRYPTRQAPALRLVRLSLLWLAGILLPVLAIAQDSGRDRVRISSGWRFTRGDPADLAVDLRYDVRPALEDTQDGEAADAEPEEAMAVADQDARVLKPWILPTANPFISDPARRHVRPSGNPGGDVPYVQGTFDDSGWEQVDLPHDWAIAGPFIAKGPYGGMGRLPSWGVGWYRRKLDIPAGDAGRSIFLDVEGAMSYATVWLNGRLVGGWPYGYNSWRLDLTPYVVPGGDNQLAIRLDNPAASARWYPGGGLYRDVWLVKTDPVHVAQWGSRVTTPQVSADSAQVNLSLAIDNDAETAAQVDVATAIYPLDAQGQPAGRPVKHMPSRTVSVPAGGSATADGSVTIASPRLWGPPPAHQPNLYLAVSTISRAGQVIDRVETRFGIRSLTFDAQQGLLVNGERVAIQGVNNHHDLGALGAAFNRRAAERQLQIMREMGVNALRMSHNPPAPALLDLADEMGFLVVNEVFDSWERFKTPLDFHLIFPDWHEADLRAMIRRDRNHPSVILWSVGNEVGEQYTGEDGAEVARRLVAIAHDEDPSRLTTTAMNYAKPDMPLPGTVDVINLNYQGVGVRSFPGQYAAFHAAFPDKVIIDSESAAALSSRGEYLFPVMGAISGPVRPGVGGDPASRHVSAYELHATDFGSSADRVFAAQDQHPYIAGEFVWTGFDYLGEPTPYYDSRSSYFGIVDLAGFPKDRFYLYQSRWRPDLRFAHILPHWTWPGREGEVTPVHVFTSADEAELFVNGVSQGKRTRAPYEYRFRWDYVTYQPGTIRVETWKNGEPWATAERSTAGAPSRIEAVVDRQRITADGRDLAYVTLRVLDADGRFVPTADVPITLSLEGPGRIVATDNGDPTDMTAFPSTRRDSFNGLALGIVQGTPGQTGELVVRARSAGLAGGEVVISLTGGQAR